MRRVTFRKRQLDSSIERESVLKHKRRIIVRGTTQSSSDFETESIGEGDQEHAWTAASWGHQIFPADGINIGSTLSSSVSSSSTNKGTALLVSGAGEETNCSL